MSSPSSPCAACKFLRRKCTQECVFAPYFPPDQPQKFVNVHKVFGASNVSKLLHELYAPQREDAVNSLAYEAEARLRDPVYGCVGLISILQHRLKQLQADLYNAKRELATYIGSQSVLPVLQGSNFMAGNASNFMAGNASSSSPPSSSLGMPLMGLNLFPQQQQQIYEAQQLAAVLAAREQREMLRNSTSYEINNSGFNYSGSSVNATGFNQMGNSTSSAVATMSPSLALGGFGSSFQIHQSQVLVQSQQDEAKPLMVTQQQKQTRNGSEEDRININN